MNLHTFTLLDRRNGWVVERAEVWIRPVTTLLSMPPVAIEGTILDGLGHMPGVDVGYMI